jgi:hypothetical protein
VVWIADGRREGLRSNLPMQVACTKRRPWLTALLTCRPTKVATVALVNDCADDLGDDDRG